MSDTNDDKKMPAKKMGDLKRDSAEEEKETEERKDHLPAVAGSTARPTKARSTRGSLRGLEDTDDSLKPSMPRRKAPAGLEDHDEEEYDEDYFDDVETGRSNTKKDELRPAPPVVSREAHLPSEATKEASSPAVSGTSTATSNAATTRPGAYSMGSGGVDASADDENTLADFTVTNQDHSEDILVAPPLPQSPPFLLSAKLVDEDPAPPALPPAVEAIEVVEPTPPNDNASTVSCSKRNAILLSVIGLVLLAGAIVGGAVALTGNGSSNQSTAEQGAVTLAPVSVSDVAPPPVSTTINPTLSPAAPVTTKNPTPAPISTDSPTLVPSEAPSTSPVLGVWSQLGQDIVGTGNDDSFGYSIAISSDGSILAVGAYWNDDNGLGSGHVRVFQRNGLSWAQLGQTIVGETAGDLFGGSVSLSSDGSIVAVGAYGNDDNGSSSGHVGVFEQNGTSWVQLGQTIVGENAGDEFGVSVSLSKDGGIIAVGASWNDDNGTHSGHVRVFQWSGSSWVQFGQTVVGKNAGDEFGRSVSLSSDGSILAVGASSSDGNGVRSGHVRVFRHDGSSWVQLGQTLVGENAGDRFGESVSLSPDVRILAVGASWNDDNGASSGHVRVFEYDGSSWLQLGQTLVGERAFDYFRESISLSSDGSILAVGSRRNGDNGANYGHVQVFQMLNGTWTQVAGAIPGKGEQDRFGISVALSADGTTVAGGADQFLKSGDPPGYVSVYQLQRP